MKKIIILSFIILFSFTLVGCNNNSFNDTLNKNDNKKANEVKDYLICESSCLNSNNGINCEVQFNFNSKDELISIIETEKIDLKEVTVAGDPKNSTEEISEENKNLTNFTDISSIYDENNQLLEINYFIDILKIRYSLEEYHEQYIYNMISDDYNLWKLRTLAGNFIKDIMDYNKETLKIALVSSYGAKKCY